MIKLRVERNTFTDNGLEDGSNREEVGTGSNDEAWIKGPAVRGEEWLEHRILGDDSTVQEWEMAKWWRQDKE